MINLTPKLTSNNQTIDGITYKTSCDSAYNASDDAFQALNSASWFTSNSALPHWWQIDMGRNINFSQFAFKPCDDVVSVTIKDFRIDTSSDGINYVTVYNGTNTISTPGTEKIINCNINSMPFCRYIKLIILTSYDTRGYKWSGMNNVSIYGCSSLFLIKDGNTINSSDGNNLINLGTANSVSLFQNNDISFYNINSTVINKIINQKYNMEMLK